MWIACAIPVWPCTTPQKIKFGFLLWGLAVGIEPG